MNPQQAATQKQVSGDTTVRVAFVVPLPEGISPGQRFRLENWFPYLEQAGIAVQYFPFFDQATVKILYAPGHTFQKIAGTLKGWLGRIKLLFCLRPYDYVFIYREAAPLGPPVLEWIMAKLLRKKLIFDFDDAIWIPQAENPMLRWLKCYWKVKHICRWSWRVSAGNAYLADYAARYCAGTVTVPTVVDTVRQHNRLKQHHDHTPVVIGWTGSHSTLKYLEMILPVLNKLYAQIPFELLVIADRPPSVFFPNIRFLQWKESTEIEDLLKIDIGIMPLEAAEWSEGKCGFKIIQYLALGIPAVATAIGVNLAIIDHNTTGFLCKDENDWLKGLSELLIFHSKRKEAGKAGRSQIIKRYSIQSQLQVMIQLFKG